MTILNNIKKNILFIIWNCSEALTLLTKTDLKTLKNYSFMKEEVQHNTEDLRLRFFLIVKRTV